MRRLALRLRVPVLIFAALALWLAPLAFRPATAPAKPLAPVARVAPTSAKALARSAAAPANLPPPPAAGTVFNLVDGSGAPSPYAVALDELYFPARPTSRRIAAIAPQADLPALLAHATALASAGPESAAPRLVLYPVGAPRNDVTRRIVNPRIDVALASADAPSPAPRPELGIVSWERPAYARDHAIARIAGDAAQPLRAAAAATSLPGVRSARPLLARQHFPRFVPNDPLFKSQWHLRNTGQQGGKSGVDIRAVPAWDTTKGAGIVVGVVDNGVDLSHPDLSPALDNSLGYDWNGNDSNPSAEDHYVDYGDYGDGETYLKHDDHGTAVSGLAAARGNNGIGVAGVAPSATLAALRLIAAPTDDSEDAAAMTWSNDVISIKNNSWGPSDDPPYVYAGGPYWLSAVADGVATGRGGLGTLYFWAAGNGQGRGDQGSLDGYASARPVIAVAATNNTGSPASFSEGGPHLVVAAPGDASGGLVTTDRVDNDDHPGYAVGDYDKEFNGTSAASPVAAGVGALLLAVRPDLGWRDVKEILLRSSTKLQATSLDWTTRPAGDAAHPIKHHPRFGGGLVNALDAITLARNWTKLGAERQLTAYPPFTFSGAASIPDNSPLGASVTFDFDGNSVLRVEHVVVTVDVTHPRRGDLEITLTSPSGSVVSQFTRVSTVLSGSDYSSYPFTSVRHWGEPSHLPTQPSKIWTLKVRDGQAGYTGTLNSATLTLYGTELAEPAIVTEPGNQALATGSTLVLTTGFSGGNLVYEWRRDGVLISGANTAEYRLANFSAKAAGTYTCKAGNPLGYATVSATVTLDDTPRATLAIRAGATTSLDLGEYVDRDVKLWKSTTLPAGLKLDPVTGLLTGRPTKPGTTSIIVTATSADGVVTRVPLTLTISPLAATVTGSYVALVSRDSTLNASLGGSLSLTVNANGSSSGSLVLGKTTYPFTGLLDGTSSTAATLNLTLTKAAVRLALSVSETDGVANLSGEIESTIATAEPPIASISGALSSWKTTTKPATTYVGAVAAAFLPVSQTELGLGAPVVTLKVTPAGRATWTITPSDGSPALTGSTPLTDQGVLLAHAPYASALGSLQATIPVPTAESPALSSDASLDWLRKPSATLAQPDGFGPLELAPYTGGGLYTKPASGVRILGLGAAAPGVILKTAPSASGVSSATPLDSTVTVSATNAFAVASPNTRKLALTFAADSGRITGTYLVTQPSTRTVRLTAVVLPAANPPAALGFVFTPGTTGVPPVSAIVTIAPASD